MLASQLVGTHRNMQSDPPAVQLSKTKILGTSHSMVPALTPPRGNIEAAAALSAMAERRRKPGCLSTPGVLAGHLALADIRQNRQKQRNNRVAAESTVLAKLLLPQADGSSPFSDLRARQQLGRQPNAVQKKDGSLCRGFRGLGPGCKMLERSSRALPFHEFFLTAIRGPVLVRTAAARPVRRIRWHSRTAIAGKVHGGREYTARKCKKANMCSCRQHARKSKELRKSLKAVVRHRSAHIWPLAWKHQDMMMWDMFGFKQLEHKTSSSVPQGSGMGCAKFY